MLEIDSACNIKLTRGDTGAFQAKDNVGKSGLYSYCYDATMAWA